MFYLTLPDFNPSAERTTPDDFEINTPEDLDNSKVGTGVLVRLYNKAVPSAPVKKFVNRATAITRTFPLLQSMANEPAPADDWDMGSVDIPAPATPGKESEEGSTTPEPQEEDVTVAAKKRRGSRGAVKSKKAVTAKASTGKRGRRNGFAGAKLFRVGEENPCRGGGLRAKSWDLIKPNGLSFEKYVENGGRPQELAFNVRQGRVKVEYPAKKSAE